MTVPVRVTGAAPRLPLVQRRRVGASGLEVSRLGLGTMMWGAETDAETAAEVLAAFVDAFPAILDQAATPPTPKDAS